MSKPLSKQDFEVLYLTLKQNSEKKQEPDRVFVGVSKIAKRFIKAVMSKE